MEMFRSPWIQCNQCGVPFNHPRGRRLYFTSCDHIPCGGCFRRPCPVCGSLCHKVVIGPKVPTRSKFYFKEMPQLKVLLRKIRKFQSSQRSAFSMRKLHRARQLNAALEEAQQAKAPQKTSNESHLTQDCERSGAMRLEREQTPQDVHRASIGGQSGGLFDQSGNLGRAAPGPGRPSELRHRSSFADRSASRNFDSGQGSSLSPLCNAILSRYMLLRNFGMSTRFCSLGKIFETGPILRDSRRRRFTPYGSKPPTKIWTSEAAQL